MKHIMRSKRLCSIHGSHKLVCGFNPSEKNIVKSQILNLPQLRVNIKNARNHHLLVVTMFINHLLNRIIYLQVGDFCIKKWVIHGEPSKVKDFCEKQPGSSLKHLGPVEVGDFLYQIWSSHPAAIATCSDGNLRGRTWRGLGVVVAGERK